MDSGSLFSIKVERGLLDDGREECRRVDAVRPMLAVDISCNAITQ